MMRKLLNQFPFLRNFLIALRHLFWTYKTKKYLKAYLMENSTRKLQLGAGSNILSGWFNTDYFPRKNVSFMDATKPFPILSASINFIFSEHHIEHISYKNAVSMLQESFRVLEPGGVIRVTTPHLKNVLSLYFNEDTGKGDLFNHSNEFILSGFYNAINYIPVDDYLKAHEINDMFYNYEHKFIYDFESLKRILKYAGFINITDCSQQNTLIKEFTNIETHIDEFDRYTTLAVEATKG
jgi:SAM-dependent methyltransferase